MEQAHLFKAIDIIKEHVVKFSVSCSGEGGWITIQQCDHELLEDLSEDGFRYSLHDGEITVYGPKE